MSSDCHEAISLSSLFLLPEMFLNFTIPLISRSLSLLTQWLILDVLLNGYIIPAYFKQTTYHLQKKLTCHGFLRTYVSIVDQRRWNLFYSLFDRLATIFLLAILSTK